MSVALFNARKQEIIAKVNECVEKGNKLFGVALPKLGIRFDLKGAAAGMACKRSGTYYVRFNTDMMLRDAWDHIINNTVPHEVAHSFCQFDKRLGHRHDAGWQRVCEALGGNGTRCHNEDVVYGKGNTYEYISTTGSAQRLSERRHKYIQGGGKLTYRKGGGEINKTCAFTIVGIQGRSLNGKIVPSTSPLHFSKDPIFGKDPLVPYKPTTLSPGVLQRLTHVEFDPADLAAAIAAAQDTKTPWQRTVQPATRITPTASVAGESKADVARRIMVQGHAAGHNYETILQAIMTANGHDRRLAASYYKNNAPKVGVPLP